MRWRYVKQNKIPQGKQEIKKVVLPLFSHVSTFSRLKAFLIDMFMIHIPILYFTTYVLLDGKDDFKSNQIVIFSCTMIFGLILSIFFSKKGQSPGYKAYDLKLIDIKTGKNPSFLRVFFRFLAFIFSCVSLVGILIIFFREDKKCLHDILSKTTVKLFKEKTKW